MCDLVWARRIFSLQTSGDIIFSLIYNGVRFSRIISGMKDIFQCKKFFPRYFLARIIFPSKSVCRIFFSETTHTPLKSQMLSPLLHPEVTTVTCYELQV